MPSVSGAWVRRSERAGYERGCVRALRGYFDGMDVCMYVLWIHTYICVAGGRGDRRWVGVEIDVGWGGEPLGRYVHYVDAATIVIAMCVC